MKEEFEFTADNAGEDGLRVLGNRLLENLKRELGSEDRPEDQQRYLAVLEVKKI